MGFDVLEYLLVFVVGVASALIANMMTRKKKGIIYREILWAPQVGCGGGLSFKRGDSTNVHLLRIKFINDGNVDISKDDFQKPITFQFNSQAKILDMSAIHRSSKSIQVYFDLKNDSNVRVTPDFFRPREWFILEFFVSEYENYNVYSRIKGIEDIKKYKSLKSFHIPFIGIFLFTVSALIFSSMKLWFFVIIFALVLIGYPLFQDYHFYRKYFHESK
ncbi:MAG: hypothetical protein HXS48_09400 [Theionarchaea archaeon]|nr:hypothetical protein [Theionarchaea archaeon]